jgi:CDP-glucose 4,6-dehydratase
MPPATTPNLFELANIQAVTDSLVCDIRNSAILYELIKKVEPEIVFHLAAQALVRASYCDPLTTFSTNIQGTANVLDSLRSIDSVKVVVAITTDKVYKNLEHPYPYRETDALGGHDPYSASKAAAEIIISSYRDSYLSKKNIAVASARAGNVIGGGDWSTDRLIPDAVRAWQSGQPLVIRNSQAIRPWQHVLEPLAGYLTLAEKLWQRPDFAGAYNFGPQSQEAATVEFVIKLARTSYGSGVTSFETDSSHLHEAGWLALETAKVQSVLGLSPKWALAESIRRTMAWYKQQQQGLNPRTLCEAEISDYEELT